MGTKMVPVIMGALGAVKKGLEQNLQLPTGHRSVTEQQNVTLMSTEHCIDKCWGKSGAN